MKKNIYLLYGGVSVEHEISIMSATTIINALDRSKYTIYPVYITNSGTWIPLEEIRSTILSPKELVRESSLTPIESIGNFLGKVYRHGEDNYFLPALHGTFGEDGTIQGFLEILDVPYLGNGVLSSAVCMDKVTANNLMQTLDIPQAVFIGLEDVEYFDRPSFYHETIEQSIGYPVFVKPANAGSSVGVSKATNRNELEQAIQNAFRYDCKIVIEEAIIGRELEVAVMGNEFPVASLPGEHVVTRQLFDYEAKYFDKTTVLKAPTEVTEQQEDRVRALAEKAYRALGCRSLARVDIFMRESDSEMLVNEVNTFPGMTGTSLFPMLWKATADYSMSQLLDKLIEFGQEQYDLKKQKSRIR